MGGPLIAGLFSAALLAAAAALGPVSAADDDAALTQRLGADWNAYDALIIGHPLRAAEQQQTVRSVAVQLRTNRENSLRWDVDIRKALETAKRYPAQVGGLRESLRYFVATRPANNLWPRFIEAHDPTIAFDRTHRRLITEASLVALQQACTLFTRIDRDPGPDAGFISRARSYLRAHFSELPPNQQEAVAHVGRDLPIIRYDARHRSTAKTAAFVRATRALLAGQDELAAHTITVLGPLDHRIALNDALTHRIAMHSLELLGEENLNMLLMNSWLMFGTP